MSVEIAPLADHPALAETLARWHFTEWSALYPGETLAQWEAELRASARRDGLPLTLVALDRSATSEPPMLLGSVSLLERDLPGRDDLAPWLASLYVTPASRGCGVGAALVRQAVGVAARLGLPRLYLFTPDARVFYERLGWRVAEVDRQAGHEVAIMARETHATA